MGVISSKNEVCNIALSQLGQKGTVDDIDTPKKPMELVFAKWYDVVRQLALKEQKPNFALARRNVAENSAVTIPFGYSYAYKYPNDCLSLLGIGDADQKFNSYSAEGGVIYTVDEYADGLPVRFVKDISDVSLFSAEFVLVFASMLADKACYEITEDDTKKQIITTTTKLEKASAASINSQENRPIRINRSKFQASRSVNNPVGNQKR